jgi:hypothetical protein
MVLRLLIQQPKRGKFMFNALFNVFSGCSHRNTTFPLTSARKLGAAGTLATPNRTYVVCLDCGTEFQYDWSNMRIGKPVSARQKVALASTPEQVAGRA